jgi:hypothetical protein
VDNVQYLMVHETAKYAGLKLISGVHTRYSDALVQSRRGRIVTRDHVFHLRRNHIFWPQRLAPNIECILLPHPARLASTNYISLYNLPTWHR